MNRDHIVAELERRRVEYAAVLEEVKEWEDYVHDSENSTASHLTFTVMSVTDKAQTPIDPSSICFQISIADLEGKEENGAELANKAVGEYNIQEDAKSLTQPFSIVLDSKDVSLNIICHRQFINIANVDKELSQNDFENDIGISEQQSVKSVPYVALFDVNLMTKDEPDNTAFTCQLEAICHEEPSLVLHVKASLDDCSKMKSVKESEAKQLQDTIQDLEDKLNAQNASQSKSSTSNNSPKGPKKQKKVKAQPAKGITAMQVLGMLYQKRSYFLFSGAVAAIYFYGEYASV